LNQSKHFRLQAAHLIGLMPIGRVTVAVFQPYFGGFCHRPENYLIVIIRQLSPPKSAVAPGPIGVYVP
jgi:hypothetical protein